MSKTTTTKAKGSAPASYRANNSYVIGVKGEDKTLGFYSMHTLGDKASIKVGSKGQAARTTRAEAQQIMQELKYKWPANIYTLFKNLF